MTTKHFVPRKCGGGTFYAITGRGRDLSRKKHIEGADEPPSKSAEPEMIANTRQGLEKIVHSKPVVDNIVQKLSSIKLPKPKKIKLEI